MKFSNDNKLLVSASSDNKVIIWNIETQELEILLEGHEDKVHSAEFNLVDDKVLSCSSDETFKLWDANTGEILKSNSDHGGFVYGARFSHDNRFIVTCS